MRTPITKQDLSLKRKYLREENKKWPADLTPIPPDMWPRSNNASVEQRRINALRSRDFLVQVFMDRDHVRMTINRTELDSDGDWKAGITWDELMTLKGQAGFADRWAVEVFPPQSEVVNVANMRHLWILDGEPAFGWRKS